jgi:hypothetical protein
LNASLQGSYIAFASADIAERPAEKILPFPLKIDLELIVDPSLQENERLCGSAKPAC